MADAANDDTNPNANNNLPDGIRQAIHMSLEEHEYRMELMQRAQNVCFDKCIEKRYKKISFLFDTLSLRIFVERFGIEVFASKYKEGELYIGESACSSRCAVKYYQVNALIGQFLANRRPPM
ncbi:hypothetical protein ACFE04_014626 [Oxalis oulophora]